MSLIGWSDNSLHDAAIVFDDNPYVLVILSSRGYTEYTSYFNQISINIIIRKYYIKRKMMLILIRYIYGLKDVIE